MTIFTRNELTLAKNFDPSICRQLVEDETFVLHCHHFMTLYTQLAIDCSMLDGKTLLAESSEDIWWEFLSRYYEKHEIHCLSKKISIAEQLFAVAGLGVITFVSAGPDLGEVIIEHSHIDLGWLKKWGESIQPVNYFGVGYIAAAFSAAFARQTRTYLVTERESMSCGSQRSRFTVVSR